MYIGNPLFVNGHLSDYLQGQERALAPYVDKILAGQGAVADDAALIAGIVEKAAIAPLAVAFEKVEKDVQPAKVRVRDYGRDIEIDGVRATYTFPFTGEPELFRLQPNTFTSVIPYGTVDRGTITLGIEGRNDPESIKREIKNQEELLRSYVDWQRKQIEDHNNALRPRVEQLVAARRKHLEGVARLKDMI
jgi:hypothetical protein